MLPNFLDRILIENMKENAVKRRERVKRKTDIIAVVAADLETEIDIIAPANLKRNTRKTLRNENGAKREMEAEVLKNQERKRGPNTDDGGG